MLEDSRVDGYIATGKGEKDLPEITDKIGKKNFSYNSGKDIFICPAGNVLKLKSTGKKRIYKGCGMCAGCGYKNKCSANSGSNATLYIDKNGIVLAKMSEKMKSKSSKKIYKDRKTIVEPVFGQIKTAGFKRFSLRGLEKAAGEFSLVCAVSNFKKIVNKIKAQTVCPEEGNLLLGVT